MNIIQARITRNYTPSRFGRIPKGVIIHTYNGRGTNLQGWFNNPIAQVSANASVIDSGDIYEYVDDADTAWANGNWEANLDYLSLEHWDNGIPSDSQRTNALYEASADWIASKYIKFGWDRYNMELIKPHSLFASTGCPGGLDINRIRMAVMQKLNPDRFYRVIKDGVQIAAFAEIDNAFNLWLDDKDQIVTFAHEDITSKFIDMANKLEKQILELMETKRKLAEEVISLKTEIEILDDVVQNLTKQNENFLKSFFGQLYLLFRKNEGKNN